MPAPVIGLGGAAILGALGLGGSIFGSSQNRRNTRDTIQANRQLADLEWQRNQEMWHMQNEYNRPAAQMARFQEAGLNPNLMYGQGNPGNATTAPKYERPNEDHRWNVEPITPALSMYADMSIKKAQIDNLQAQNQRIIQSTVTDAVRAANIGANTAKTEFDLGLARELKNNSLDVARENLRKIRTDIDYTLNAQSESQLRQIGLHMENDLNKSLKPYGMTTKDNMLMRMFMNIFHKNPGKVGIPENMIPTWTNPF